MPKAFEESTAPNVGESKIRSGISKLAWLVRLKNSTRSSRCRCFSPTGTFFERSRSKLRNAGPIRELRPAFPNRLVEGAAKAQGLNQAAGDRTRSAARPPAETVEWHAGSGLARTGPAVYGSAIASGRSKTPKSALVAL